MELRLNQVSKRFKFEWIFKDINLQIPNSSQWAITGSNGSGKSTLLKCLSGLNPLTKGEVTYFDKGKQISAGAIFNDLVISAPYMELPEEFTLTELLAFHFKFKKPVNDLSFGEMIEIMYLDGHQNKPIYEFSSGMKQRLKLGLCFFSDCKLIFLDEPTSNLDEQGKAWYLHLISKYSQDRTIFICSNDPREYDFCPNELKMADFKLKQRL